MRIPVISDTHGVLRPAVAEALEGASLILHAGDVGTAELLEVLGAIAPLHAIRGNVDRGEWAQALPATELIELAGRYLYLIHDRGDIDLDPEAGGAGIDIVVSGHSHRPLEERRDGTLWLNPGSVGPRRFDLPISMAWLILPEDPGAPPEVEFVRFAP